jgi:hypothetical protein
MDNAYRDAMLEHVAELAEELSEYRDVIKNDPKPKIMNSNNLRAVLLKEPCNC